MNIIENDFGLPRVPEDLDKEEFEYRNKYRNIYLRLIVRCQAMTEDELSGYNEKHHIIPKCLGGCDEIYNLVLMPVRYHIMAHILLFKVFPDNTKIAYAVNSMINGKNKWRKECIIEKFSTRVIASIREEFILSVSGENNPNFGKPRSEETKKRLSDAALNRSEEAKERIRKARALAGYHPLSQETKNKLSLKLKGRKLSEETKEKLSLQRRRGMNSNSTKVIGPDGTEYSCIRDASDITGIPYSTLCKWLDGTAANNRGWAYVDKKSSYNNRDMSKSSKSVVGPDGTVYETIKSACDLNAIPYTTMRYWISGRVKNNHGWKLLRTTQSD